MAFWWPLIVLGFAYAVCKFLLLLIPPNVPSIDVDVSDVVDDGSQIKDNSFIYIPTLGRQTDKVQCYEPATMKYLGFFPALKPDEPATMKYLGFFPALKPDEVRERVAQARKAQKHGQTAALSKDGSFCVYF